MRVDSRRATKVFRGRGRDGGARGEGGICEGLVDELCETRGVDAGSDDGDVARGESLFGKRFHGFEGDGGMGTREEGCTKASTEGKSVCGFDGDSAW